LHERQAYVILGFLTVINPKRKRDYEYY